MLGGPYGHKKNASMTDNKQQLINNIDGIHTTEMGIERIKNNLDLGSADVVKWCKTIIKNKSSIVNRKGKNWYVTLEDIVLIINAYSFTIITAHKSK